VDVSAFLPIRPAPRVVFDQLAERADDVRFYVRTDGNWQPVTWQAFADRIRDVALFLADRGFEPGDRAAIFAHNSVDWAATALGIQAAGGVMVPIYPASTPEQIDYVVGHSGAKIVFTAEADANVSCDTARLGTAPSAPGRDAELSAMIEAIDLERPGLMLYTSGTSGNPKGVPLTHRNVGANAADWLVSNAPLLELGAVDLLWLPMSHIFGFGELCTGNTLGYITYLCTPKEVVELLPEVKPSVFMSVPAYWEKLAKMAAAPDRESEQRAFDAATGGKMRFCLSGGAGLKREVKELFHRCGALILEGYGLTETSPTLTINKPADFRFDTVGKPLGSVELKLADDGEIFARGPNVFSGYHDDPVATREAFTDDGWFKTGDVGRFTDEGFLQIVDRKKDILVTAGGKNVPPANIEVRFRDDPSIEHVVVYGDGKKYLVAAVWLGDDGSPDPNTYVQSRIDVVNSGLARFETIKKFCIVDEPLTVENGMLTASLKLRRKKIYERYRGELEALYA
jgi:long-chain acyl-CoA synthetase